MPNDDLAPRDISLAFDWLSRRLADLSVTPRSAGPAAHPEQGLPAPARHGASPRGPEPETGHAPGGPPPAATPSSTPLLDKVGRDLTALARARELPVILGRESEIESVIETLVRNKRHNPLLIAPEGTGRTAIVEGLAARIVAGDVPEMLRDRRIIEVSIGELTAGTQYRGQLEERLLQFAAEAATPGHILFFPDIHMLAGAGATENSAMGADAILGPALSRGEITVIGTGG